MADSTLQSLVEQFVAQVQDLARKEALAQVIAQLQGGAAPGRRGRGPGRPKGSGGTSAKAIKPVRKGKRRSAEDVEAMGEALLAHVKANPGARGEQIAAAMKSDVGTIRLPMKALIAARKITTRGERRGMQYFVAGTAPRGPAKGAGKKRGRGAKKS